jgi:hypothetical protein
MTKDEALKMAIDALKEGAYGKEKEKAINTCKEALASNSEALEAEQKPVAYWNGSTSFDYYKYDADGFIVSEFEIHDWKPLYTKEQL